MDAPGGKNRPFAVAHTTTGDPGKGTSLTMLKGLTILEYVASQPNALAVGEVAAATDMDKSTVSRLLASLRFAGYVRQGRDRRYQLTSKLLFLTRNFVPAEHLRDAARSTTEHVHAQFDEAVHVAAIDAGEVVFVDFLDSSHTVRSQTPTTPSPLHLTAIGHAALSRMVGSARTIALRKSAAAAECTLDDVDTIELSASLELTRERGFSIYEAGDDVARVAAAIVNSTGEPVGGMSVSGPTYRLKDRIEEIGRVLAAATARIQG